MASHGLDEGRENEADTGMLMSITQSKSLTPHKDACFSLHGMLFCVEHCTMKNIASDRAICAIQMWLLQRHQPPQRGLSQRTSLQ